MYSDELAKKLISIKKAPQSDGRCATVPEKLVTPGCP